jgi:hypothetical protein
MVEDKVRIPGILLMVVAGINLGLQMIQIAYYGLIAMVGLAAPSQGSGGGGGEEQLVIVLYITVMIVITLFAVAWNAFIMYSGWKMQRLESYNLVLTGSILAALPCFGCCLLSMPVGIVAIVTLNDRLVKEAFRS